MAQLIDITKVAVAPQHLTARVTIANGGPLTTDEDLVGTTHVYNLLPDIVDHACLGDAGSTFKDVMGATEVAHLLEHVAIELMARTGIAGDISCGRTWEVTGEPRTYDVQLACPDDVLVASALSSAAWILQWAYSGARDPKPDVDAIVAGIRSLVADADKVAAEREAERAERAAAGDAGAADGAAGEAGAGEDGASKDAAAGADAIAPGATEGASADPAGGTDQLDARATPGDGSVSA